MDELGIRTVLDDGKELLQPLLFEKNAKIAEYKKRNNAYNYKIVHVADVEDEATDGWELVRAGKKSAKLKRLKPQNQKLEDRLWCLFYKMSYQNLGSTKYTINFERHNGAKGRKQIDVFAGDEETAFVVECKAKKDRGRRNLQNDIQDTAWLKNYIQKCVYKIYGDKSKPKVVWIYATSNIIWTEKDAELANENAISVITENEVQYFEAFLKHMGPAGRYQILGEFLKGQRVSGLEDIRLPAVKGKIGGEVFYSFVATPRRLLKIAFINHQALNHPDGRPAYQRMISSSRITEIGNFIQGGGYFPTNLLINFTDTPRFDLLSNKENTDPNIKFGWITLPNKYRSAWIIDGQHRLYGYSHLEGKYLDQSLFVLAFEKMDNRKEANLFITINSKQKSVPKSLLVSLLADLRLGDGDAKTALSALSSAIVRAINTDKTSPLARRFSTPGVPPELNQNLTISEAVNGLTRSGLIGKVINKTRISGPLSTETDAGTIERARKILNKYFEELRAANPIRWEAGKNGYISNNPGIRAHLGLIAEIVTYLEGKNGEDFDTLLEDDFSSKVLHIAKPVFDYIRSASDNEVRELFSRKFGEAGVREYLFHLYQIIHEKRSDFGSEDFLRWITQKASDRISDANSFVMHLSEMITDCVIATLKGVHGTHRLESGEQAFWELGIEDRKIKERAYAKHLGEKSERRRPKEAYLDIVELVDIMKQKNNWPHFEPIFNLPMSNEKKGKAYYLQWIYNFNELRNIAAHKSSMRTYKDSDLEFLDWLRVELEPRLKAELEKK